MSEGREELQKKRQILYSWSWFYSNSKNNLMYSRYDDKSYINEGFNNKYGKAIYNSLRFKEDKAKCIKLNNEIEDNQVKLNRFFKKSPRNAR